MNDAIFADALNTILQNQGAMRDMLIALGVIGVLNIIATCCIGMMILNRLDAIKKEPTT